MNIKKINITSFGKLSDFELQPKSGLNVIYAPNESGKTTILSFLKYIFYGTKQKKQSGELTFKEKYTPWSSANLSGSCEFEIGGKTYSVQRTDGEHISKLSVFNTESGEFLKNITNPGMYFMKIGERAFTDSCFITNVHSITDSSSDGELISYLSDFCDDKSTYSKIHRELTENLFQLTSDKRKTSALSIINADIKKNQEMVLQLKNKISSIESEVEKLKEAEDKICYLTKESEKLKMHKNKLEYGGLISERNSLYDEKKKLQAALLDIEKENTASCSVISDEEKTILTQDFSEYKSNINEYRYSLFKHRLLFWFGLLMLGAVVCASFYFKPALYSLPAIAVTVYIFLKGYIKSKKKLKKSAEQYESKIINQKSVMNKYGLISREDCLSFISSQKNKQELYKASQEQISYLKKHIAHVDSMIEKCNFKIKELGSDSPEYINSEYDDIKFFTNRDINDIIDENDKLISELSLYLTRNLHLKEELAVLTGNLASAEAGLEHLEEEKNVILSKADIIEKSLLILDKAFSEAKSTFFPRLSQKTAEIFCYVTNDSDYILNSNDKFEIFFTRSGFVRNAKFLSRGTLDILYFSLRIAIIELMGNSGVHLPVFLDDIFSNCDDERTVRLMEVIFSLSKTHQVFLCTCRGREGNYFKNNPDVNIIM